MQITKVLSDFSFAYYRGSLYSEEGKQCSCGGSRDDRYGGGTPLFPYCQSGNNSNHQTGNRNSETAGVCCSPEYFPRYRSREYRHSEKDRHGVEDERNTGKSGSAHYAAYDKGIFPLPYSYDGQTAEDEGRKRKTDCRRQTGKESALEKSDVSCRIDPDRSRSQLAYRKQIAELFESDEVIFFHAVGDDERNKHIAAAETEQGKFAEKEKYGYCSAHFSTPFLSFHANSSNPAGMAAQIT